MSFFSGDNLRAVTSGRWLHRPPAGAIASGVGIDTRTDLAGKVFVALRGERHDGHDHLDAAAAAGALLAIVEREIPAPRRPEGLGLLRVDDPRRALGRLARAYRRSLVATRVIAITGSAGKTTTKNLVHALLSTAFPGSAAPRSFNNDVGVPMTILAARPHHKYLVVEIGTNAPGEIAHLAGLVEPDIAVVTNVGRAHLAGFGSVEAIAREKASLLSHLRPHGTAFLNADAPGLDRYARALPSVVRFGDADGADLRLTGRGQTGGAVAPRWWLEVNGRMRFDLALPGRHNAINALAAIGIGRRFGLDDERMSAALAAVAPEPMRLVLEMAGEGEQGLRLYNDAYNANPESMAAALETFIESAAGAPRRIAILGDMLELGDDGAALHRDMGRLLVDVDTRKPIEHAFLVGSLSAHAGAVLGRVWSPERFTMLDRLDAGAVAVIMRHLRPRDAVLVKASRGIGLERLVAVLVERAKGAPTVEVKGLAPGGPAGAAGIAGAREARATND